MRSRVLLVAAILLLLLSAACNKQVWTTANVSSYVAQELPDGSDRRHVTSFLDRRNIEHTDNAQDIVAIFRNKPSATESVHSDVQVTFHFGADGKLVSRKVEPTRTGP